MIFLKRISLFTVIVLLLSALFMISSYAAQDSKSVYDRANIFTDEEAARIETAANRHFANKKASVYIVTDSSSRVRYFGDHFKEEYDVDKNAVILIITDNNNKNYDVYTYGSCDRKISFSEIDIILDDPEIYDNIKYNSDPASAAIRFIELSADACETEVGGAIILGIVFGITVSGITFGCVVYSYKRKSRSEKYPLERFANLELTMHEDNFAGSFVTRRVIRTNNNHSGRSGGFSSRGSGHRGGR